MENSVTEKITAEVSTVRKDRPNRYFWLTERLEDSQDLSAKMGIDG